MIAGPIPGYWMNETSGVLRPAVEAYLYGDPMTDAQIVVVRAYLRQWIGAPAWQGPMIDVLRASVERIVIRSDIDRWVRLAEQEGIDPF
jgi:hypothetical protein